MSTQHRWKRYATWTPAIAALFLIYIFVIVFREDRKYDTSSLMRDPFGPSPRKAERTLNITIVIVIEENTNLDDYDVALNTLECYALQHKYELRIVKDSEFPSCRGYMDMMFRRHCVVAEILMTSQWVLFLDADVGIVNPNRLIEEFVDESIDITFYDRFYNWEVAAGAYIVKNSSFSQKWLRGFADYEQKLPDSFHGTDNGALHMYIAETMRGEMTEELEMCRHIWRNAHNYDGLFEFEACIRSILGARLEYPHFRVLKKGRGWMRDSFLTTHRYSLEGDFMLHGWKQREREEKETWTFRSLLGIAPNVSVPYPPRKKSGWVNPWLERLDRDKCARGEGNWKADQDLIVPKTDIDRVLRRIAIRVEAHMYKAMGNVANYLHPA